jgi:hypothetical protein
MVAAKALKAIAKGIVKNTAAGDQLRLLKADLWPGEGCTSTNPSGCTGANVYNLIESDKINFAADTLDAMSGQIDGFFEVEESSLITDPGAVKDEWLIVESQLSEKKKPVFQAAGYEVALLPLFAQYENLYLSFLRYGILEGPKTGMTEETIREFEERLEAEVRSSQSYATAIFTKAVHAKEHFDDNQKQYKSKNPEWVDKRIKALDFRDAWPLQDPLAYPYGDPNFRQERMIYSDEWGRTHDSNNFPDFGMDDATGDLTNPPMPNVEHPLTQFTAWMKQEWTKAYDPNGDYRNFLSAIKLDNAPVEGSISGDTALTPDEYGAKPARYPYAAGAGSTIAEVGATWAERNPLLYPQDLIQVIKLNFSDGRSEVPGGAFYSAGDRTRYWAYPDEVLATARIMGRYEWEKGDFTGNAIVFGFRFDDSFDAPAPRTFGRVTAPAPNDGACLAVEQMTLQGSASWIHTGQQTGKREDGAKLQMYACDYAGWVTADDPATEDDESSQTTAWETTWGYGDDAAPRPLTVYGGTKCMAPATDANGNWATAEGFPTTSSTTWPPPPHTLVAVYDCNGSGAQNWTVDTDGTIRPADANDLCLDRVNGATANGTPVQLNTCTGGTAQKWTRP